MISVGVKVLYIIQPKFEKEAWEKMDATVVAAIITAFAAITVAIIRSRTAKAEQNKRAEIEREWEEFKGAVSRRESYLDIDYGVKIISPGDGLLAGDIVEVRGVYEIPPPPETLRLYTVHPERTPYGERFWPQEVVKDFFPNTKTWRAKVHVGGLPSRGQIVVAVVSQPAIVLWNYYYKVGLEIGWWDIEGWPNDSVIYDRVTITKA